MKKSKLILSILSIPTMSMVLLPLVSCGDKDKELTIDFKNDGHITKVTTEGELKTNKAFKIIPTFATGWKQFDTTNTYIKVDGEKLTAGTHYEFEGGDHINVHANVIKSTNVEVYIATKPTYVKGTFKWKNLDSDLKIVSGFLCVPLGTAIGKSNVDFTVTLGDGTIITPEYGTGNGKYVMLNKKYGKEVTGFSTDEYKYPESIFTGKTQLVQIPLFCEYIEDVSSLSQKGETAFAWAGKKPTTLTVKYTGTPLKVDDTISLECSAGTNEFPFCDFTITSGSEYAEIKKDEDTGLWSITGKAAGTVTVEATSIFDSTVTTTGTFTVKAQE